MIQLFNDDADTDVPETKSDEQLAARGDAEQLYLRYGNRVFRFAIRRLGERAAAEDATSRVFERMLVALPRYRTGSFRAWLFTIARNEVIDAYRRGRHHAPLAEAASVHDERPGPEAVAIRDDEAKGIRSLLRQLPEEQRQVVELRLAHLNDREIAQVLGKSHGAVRTAQYRALRRLRDLIELETDKVASDGQRDE